MRNPALLKTLLQLHQKTTAGKLRQYPKSNAGFTLIELIVVVVMIGVLAAIAAPSWTGFLNQRRANAAQDIILSAVQQAQSEAKKNKLTYSVSLVAPSGGVPKVAVAQGSTPPVPDSPYWKSLAKDQNIRPGQIWLGTNATSSNIADDNIGGVDGSPKTVITFDYTGALLPSPSPSLGSGNEPQGLIIAVGALPSTTASAPVPSTRRCVKVSTLLGSIQGGKVDSSSTPNKCVPI